jgi:hypothetical protein
MDYLTARSVTEGVRGYPWRGMGVRWVLVRSEMTVASDAQRAQASPPENKHSSPECELGSADSH